MTTTYFQSSLFVMDHKEVFKQIRNFLAGRFVGATRDRALLDEVVKCLFCKVYLVTHVQEFSHNNDGSVALTELYERVFTELKDKLPSIFDRTDQILLDPESIEFIDNKLGEIELVTSKRDYFGDLYEVLIGSGIREEEGQFFTPQNGTDSLVSIINPQPGEKIIDPACGAGGFLSSTARHLLEQGDLPQNISNNLVGIDKDAYLTKLAATRLALITLLPGNIYCADSLAWSTADSETLELDNDESYDVVLTNPPFGKRIVAASQKTQGLFDLGHHWKLNRGQARYERTTDLLRSVPPQVLFVEKCLSLLRPNGRLGVVVPESLVTSKSYRHVVQYMREQGQIETVIGMPEEFFKTSGKGGTHTKACLITLRKHNFQQNGHHPFKIFMAEAGWCGHDSRGRMIDRDDLPKILETYEKLRIGQIPEQNALGYMLPSEKLVNNVLSPRYYNPKLEAELTSLKGTHDLIKFGELISDGLLQIQTGDEVGKLAYGTGSIPFVRTSDISNWEVKIDPKHGVSEDIYKKFAQKQDVRSGDILMVKDGTYLIGTCAFITEYDTQIIYQSHLYKIRVTNQAELSPYLLLAILSSEPLQKQIKAKRFTQDIIDSLGRRINELILPIPKDRGLRERVSSTVEQAIKDRIEARELARQACLDVIGHSTSPTAL